MSNGATIVSQAVALCAPSVLYGKDGLVLHEQSAELAIWGTCKGFGMHVWSIVGTGMQYMVGSILPS